LNVLTAGIRRLVILLDVRVSIGCFMRNNRGEGRDPINRFNSATFLHTSEATTWIPNIVCCSWFSCYWWCWWPLLLRLFFQYYLKNVCWSFPLYTAGNRHKQNTWFCKEIREDNFRFWWRRVHEDASQGMYMSKIEIFFFTAQILQNQRMLCCGECFHD
jgi:hypothetical protein